ncbi:hypothetical protein PG993_007009 [Apiospora rasikravindrae]|uniref:Uncharacterized protein n=1 Tax=Apiospora rasikravindrae TaxID=990691 RepID=A0ABR1SYI7_9PEZI
MAVSSSRSNRAVLIGSSILILSFTLWRLSELPPEYTAALRRRFEGPYSAGFTNSALAVQFSNPQGVVAVLLLIGGDVIAKAIAQLSGTYENRGITPVLFSFGWVSYAFTQISNAIGNGAFYPAPDYPLLRDCEGEVDQDRGIAQRRDSSTALHIGVCVVDDSKVSYRKVKSKRDWLWWSFTLGLVIQLGLAIIPMLPTAGRPQPNFYILLITVIGTLLSFLMATQRGTRQEKFGLRTGKPEVGSRGVFALTKGNGHNIALIILPNVFPEDDAEQTHLPYLDSMATSNYHQSMYSRLATGGWAVLWIILLLMVGGAQADSWYLLGVGGVGMVHTSLIASLPRSAENHGIPLMYLKEGWTVTGSKKMEALLRLEELIPGAGFMLRREFFNGPESSSDRKMWRAFTSEEGLNRRQLEQILLLQGDLRPTVATMRAKLNVLRSFPTSQNNKLIENWSQGELSSLKKVHLRGRGTNVNGREWLEQQQRDLGGGSFDVRIKRLKQLVMNQADGLEVRDDAQMRSLIYESKEKPWEERMSRLIELRRRQWRSAGEFVHVREMLSQHQARTNHQQ